MRIILLFSTAILLLSCQKKNDEWIRINQLGYRTNDTKVAVFIALGNIDLKSFRLVDAASGKIILEKKEIVKSEPLAPFKSCFRLHFSELYRRWNLQDRSRKCCFTRFQDL